MIQRVDKASVSIEGKNVGCIGEGLVVFIGVENRDTERDVAYLADKTAGLRIFPDSAGKFNLSCKDIDGECLIISQFTLFADTRHGKRPGFTDAAARIWQRSCLTCLLSEFVQSVCALLQVYFKAT